MIPVGIQLYSVRDAMEQDAEGTLRALKEFGYDGVELCGFYGKTPEELRAILEDIGLTPISAHVGFDDLRRDAEKVINQYIAVGCKNITIPWLAECDRVEGGNFAKTVADIAKIGEEAKKLGVVLSYHNHYFEFEKFGEVYALDYIYDTVPADMLKAEIDVCWVSASGVDPVEYLKKYSGRLPLVHIKDYEGVLHTENFGVRPVGYGVQDIKTICDTAAECGAEWLIVEQDFPALDKTAVECARMSREFLKSVGY